MKVAVYNGNSKEKDLKLSEIWDSPSEKVLHQVVVARLANERQGNAHSKTRSEVVGSGKKPWRQKGLGRARAGTKKSPLWRGGGVTFGPRHRDFTQKINKKMKANAYLYAFNKLNAEGLLKVISGIEVSDGKTKSFLKELSTVVDDVNAKLYVIVDSSTEELKRSSRNLPNVKLCDVNTIDILPLVYAQQVVATSGAMQALDEKFTRILKG